MSAATGSGSSSVRRSAVRPVVTGLAFPESPRWHDGRLWISDMAGHEILQFSAAGERLVAIPTPFQPSGLGWLPDNSLIVVAMHERAVMRVDGESCAVHADLAGGLSAEANDMVSGPDGTAYVTNFGYDPATEEPRATELVLVRPDGSVEMQEGPLLRPNGVAITPDGSTLIVAETRVHRLTAFSIGHGGQLSNPRIVATLPSGTWADGICLDEAGAVWVADPKGKTCRRVLADGSTVQVIDTAPMACVSCTLGGDGRRTLFMALTALGNFADRVIERAGRVDMVGVEVGGPGWP